MRPFARSPPTQPFLATGPPTTPNDPLPLTATADGLTEASVTLEAVSAPGNSRDRLLVSVLN